MPGSPPSGFNNQPVGYLTAREAAAMLGIKRDTLYAYVSRGWVRTVVDPGAPGSPRRPSRLYAREDLVRLRARHDARAGHGPVAATALQWGEAVLPSVITRIDAEGPWYRGHRAVTLAQADTRFESVAWLLWDDRLVPEAMPPGTLVLPPALADLAGSPTGPLSAMAMVVAWLGAPSAREPPPGDPRATLVRAVCASLALPDLSRARQALAETTLARSVLTALGVEPDPWAVQAMNRALVLCADHELNPSAFAARIAASTGASMAACVGAALATASGRLHAAATDAVEDLADTVATPARVGAVLPGMLGKGTAIPGAGHPLYPGGDPRATALLAAARTRTPPSRRTETLLAMGDWLARTGTTAPTVDLGLAALAAALNLPRGAAAGIFAVGRTAGWIAHAMEQQAHGSVLRPRARYVGRESTRTEPSVEPTSATEAMPRK